MIFWYIYIYRRGEREREDPFEHTTNKMSRKNLVGGCNFFWGVSAVKRVEIKEFKFLIQMWVGGSSLEYKILKTQCSEI